MMTSHSRNIAALLAALVMLAGGSQASAQRGAEGILFVDQQRLLSESKAGQSIDEQLARMASETAQELSSVEAKIKEEGQALKASRDSLSEEDFAKRYDALIAKVRKHEQLKQIRQAELSQARTEAISKLADAWEPILERIFNERDATVLLEKQSVLAANASSDISDEVLARLDKKVRTIDVVRPDLEGEVAAAEEAILERARLQSAPHRAP